MKPKRADRTPKPAHPIERWWRTISIDLFRLSLIALAPSLVGFAYWFVALPKSDPRADWPTIDGVVSSLSTRDGSCRVRRFTFGESSYAVQYAFRIAESTYSGSLSGCAEDRESATEQLRERVGAPLQVIASGDFTTEFDPAGHRLRIYYNPQNPTDHTTVLRTPLYFWVIGILTGSAIVLSILAGPGVVLWNLVLLRIFKDSGKKLGDTFLDENALLDEDERRYLPYGDPKLKELQQAAKRALREVAPAESKSIEIVTKMLLRPDRIYFDLILSSDAVLDGAKAEFFEERFLNAANNEIRTLKFAEDAVGSVFVELHSRQTINRQGADAYWR